jgi:hypothetical protein
VSILLSLDLHYGVSGLTFHKGNRIGHLYVFQLTIPTSLQGRSEHRPVRRTYLVPLLLTLICHKHISSFAWIWSCLSLLSSPSTTSPLKLACVKRCRNSCRL